MKTKKQYIKINKMLDETIIYLDNLIIELQDKTNQLLIAKEKIKKEIIKAYETSKEIGDLL